MLRESACAACGKVSEQPIMAEYKTIGFPDLDGRPAPMYRNMMKYWLEECPHCGYIAPEIAKNDEDLNIPLMMSGYNLARHWHIPALAKRFARYALGLRTLNRDDIAWQYFLDGVWACEDEHDAAGTDMMLRCTIDAIELALMACGGEQKTRSMLLGVKADVLRRLGLFDEVEDISVHDLTDDSQRLISYEKLLAKRRDAKVHNSSELWQSLDDVEFINSALLYVESGEGFFSEAMLERLYRLACEGGSAAAKQCLFEFFDRGIYREQMASLSTFARISKG